jgi:hypothetical protein
MLAKMAGLSADKAVPTAAAKKAAAKKDLKPVNLPALPKDLSQLDKKAWAKKICEELLMEVAYVNSDNKDVGYTYPEMLARVKLAYPDSNTSVKCLRWYAAHMKDLGTQLPIRPRAPSVKK